MERVQRSEREARMAGLLGPGPPQSSCSARAQAEDIGEAGSARKIGSARWMRL